MPASKRHPGPRRPAKPSKAAPRRRAKTQALAVADAVKRGAPGGALFASPLTLIEPLRRRIVDRQIAFLSAALAWSPAHIIAHQQAAFWDGFAEAAAKSPAARPRPRKRAKRK